MPTVDQLGTTTDKIADKPVAYVAAFFALCFLGLLSLYIREKGNHARVLLRIVVAQQALLTRVLGVLERVDRKLGKGRKSDTEIVLLDTSEGGGDGGS